MKKKICLILLCVMSVFACVFGLAACGSNGENKNSNNNPEQGGNDENLESYEPTEGLKYTVNGSYCGVTGIGTVTDTEIFIANTYNGKPVTYIGQSAFSFTGITNVTIPDSLTEINDWAFSYSGLTSITIPDSVTSIGFGAFDYCDSLTSVTIGKGVTSVGANMFLNCSSLNSVTINDGLKSIGDGMFQGCNSLTSITIPNGVTSIGNLAFSECSSLTSITIPNSLTRIGMSAFYGCNNLNVYFAGSKQEWNEIDIGDGNNDLINASLHYNSVENENSDNNGNDSEDNPKPVYQKHTLTYNLNYNGASTMAQQIAKGENVNLINPQRAGYEFLGWYYYGNKIESGIWQYDSDITLTARWEAIKYTITYNTDGGIIPDSSLKSFTVSDYSYTLPVPTKQGYNFVGWYESADFSGELIAVIHKNSLQNYVLYAKYTDEQLLEFELSFDETYYSVIGYKGAPQYITVPETTDGLPVKEIATKAFESCNTLINITLPNNVYKIGNYAISRERDIPKIPKTIQKSLQMITIPDGVTSIGSYAFYDCDRLTSITIPDSVTNIDDYAFSGCSSLISITIPDSVTTIGSSAFSGCGSLTSITLPDGVTTIGSSAFSGCSSLTSVTIPDSVTYIYSSAFPDNLCKRYSDCYYLPTKDSEYGFLYNAISTDITNVKIHTDCKTINSYAFYCCRSLTSITIPNGVTSIGDVAFCGCDSLISITLPDSVTSIGESAFSGCRSLISITLPDSVTSIGESAFSGCSSLTSIIIPDGVTSISGSAFYECYSLKSITIPDGVTSIGDSAFYDCEKLTSITLPDSVTRIDRSAFGGGYNIISVYYKGTADGWSNITGNDAISETKLYYYSATEPTDDGKYWHYDTDGKTPVVWKKGN